MGNEVSATWPRSFLAEALLEQAMIGPSPNPLILSYLKYAISSQVIALPVPQTLLAVTSRPQLAGREPGGGGHTPQTSRLHPTGITPAWYGEEGGSVGAPGGEISVNIAASCTRGGDHCPESLHTASVQHFNVA